MTQSINDEKRTGPIKRIGNVAIFYEVYCGTACMGIKVVNLHTGVVNKATIANMDFEPENGTYTTYDDWTGKEYTFQGFPDDITSESDEIHSSLILHLVNEKNLPLGENQIEYLNSDFN